MTPEEQAGDVCLRCGEPFETRNEGEPGYCDLCAQELIREKDQRIAELEEAIKSLFDQCMVWKEKWESADKTVAAIAGKLDGAEYRIATLEQENRDLQKSITEEKEHSNWMAERLCKLEDSLVGESDDAFEKAMERIRDLIAKEGELGDAQEENRDLRAGLEPFAQASIVFNKWRCLNGEAPLDGASVAAHWPLELLTQLNLQVKHLRRAAALLKKEPCTVHGCSNPAIAWRNDGALGRWAVCADHMVKGPTND